MRRDGETQHQPRQCALVDRRARLARQEHELPAADRLRLAEHGKRAVRQRHPVRSPGLHARRRDSPDGGLEVHLGPGRASRLPGACGAQDHRLEGELDSGTGAGCAHLRQRRRDFAVRQRQARRRPSLHPRQRRIQNLARRIVRPEPLRDRPLHHQPEALPDAPRLVHRGPGRRRADLLERRLPPRALMPDSKGATHRGSKYRAAPHAAYRRRSCARS